jgi:Kef-type K+ transport system membrane component KefB
VLHQPPVIGEIIAGIVLRPSFLARLRQVFRPMCFAHRSRLTSNVLAQVGVGLYMFLVRLDLDPGLMRYSLWHIR